MNIVKVSKSHVLAAQVALSLTNHRTLHSALDLWVNKEAYIARHDGL